MEFASQLALLRAGKPAQFPGESRTRQYAQMLDSQDEIKHLREHYIIPTKASLRKTTLDGRFPGKLNSASNGASSNGSTNGHVNGNGNGLANGHHEGGDDDEEGIYFVGNSLGAQPKAMRHYLEAQLETWASVGVHGHFNTFGNSPLVAWQDMAEACAVKLSSIVGAKPGEVVVMNSLTANLHFMMASFYRPTEKKHKIILEWRPFPSDYYAIESQIQWHGLDPSKSMVKIDPEGSNSYISTEKVLSVIDEHAEEAALLLLPGIQYYSGQLLDIPRITSHARAKGLIVGWDLAHAAGNVELSLHDWDVDFACWCTYKYLNAGPGAIAGVFVHERHGGVEYPAGVDGASASRPISFQPRLTGWYGGDKRTRFLMDNVFRPTPGAGGFQVSNPSAIDLAALSAAMSVFERTSMKALREKALVLTAYAEHLLDMIIDETRGSDAATDERPFRIITPRNPLERGTQLSLLLRPELLDRVSKALRAGGVSCDQRKPDVIRVAPVPMYCTFDEIWRFVQIFRCALEAS